MKNSRLSLVDIDLMIVEKLSDQWIFFDSRREIWLRDTAVVYPLLEARNFSNSLSIQNLDFSSLIFYIIYAHYNPVSELRSLMKLELLEKLERDPEHFWLRSVVFYKTTFLSFLQDSNLISYRSLIGLLGDHKKIRNLQTNIKFNFETNKEPRKSQRRRGYNDKGTLPNSSLRARRLQLQEDFNSQQEQIELEELRELRDDVTQFLEGLITL